MVHLGLLLGMRDHFHGLRLSRFEVSMSRDQQPKNFRSNIQKILNFTLMYSSMVFSCGAEAKEKA